MKTSDEPGFTSQEALFTQPGVDLSRTKVAILGLGLMGGSLALALREKCALLIGIDQDMATLDNAKRRQIVDQVSHDAGQLLPHADLVVISVPVFSILSFLAELPSLHPGSPVVLDFGSTKREIITAMKLLPERFQPIGGHPMCGKEKSGLDHAEAGLFQGAPFALTVLPQTTQRAIDLATGIVKEIGAHPVWIDSDTHDRWVASTSHLPYLLACALAASTPEEAAPMIGSGYRSTSRLAASPPAVMLDILATNREAVLAAVNRFRVNLDRLAGLLADVQVENELRGRLDDIRLHQASLLQENTGRRT